MSLVNMHTSLICMHVAYTQSDIYNEGRCFMTDAETAEASQPMGIQENFVL